MNKDQTPLPGLAFSPDISGLYKPVLAAQIPEMNVTLRFLKPNFVQLTLLIDWMINALQDAVTTPEQRSSMNRIKLRELCALRLQSYSVPGETPADQSAKNEEMNDMFTNSLAANTSLMEVICQCFPDIDDPENLTDNALIAIVSYLMKSVFFQQ
jgi:hypothetical protein